LNIENIVMIEELQNCNGYGKKQQYCPCHWHMNNRQRLKKFI